MAQHDGDKSIRPAVESLTKVFTGKYSFPWTVLPMVSGRSAGRPNYFFGSTRKTTATPKSVRDKAQSFLNGSWESHHQEMPGDANVEE
jgi:hypothetical protein